MTLSNKKNKKQTDIINIYINILHTKKIKIRMT